MEFRDVSKRIIMRRSVYTPKKLDNAGDTIEGTGTGKTVKVASVLKEDFLQWTPTTNEDFTEQELIQLKVYKKVFNKKFGDEVKKNKLLQIHQNIELLTSEYGGLEDRKALRLILEKKLAELTKENDRG